MELESFLACARGLLVIPSTADRPEDLYRAEYVDPTTVTPYYRALTAFLTVDEACGEQT